ncbi:MAG: aminotransferase class III-fold pyridoxal phosphate-dependent enzyme [Actinobacteria bacterium]|nr:aminotransferase class III-fold pyridoxal phosphate-dependent enzyme [Actinomycetota bacterium]NIS31182.1 aminotransferase class III-fold pyridoxal phosphate-dependent enzyme [Actinomycetota bacterium]NIT95526.1 aminotransferase class III-fold pyridoxal phosphate-dependent enzyme [Actinomycetota bacterium]NIU19221.1 aminotransferase class III-fold pyridoxal phosphate-dependent enzyme [Actinomycetota bacterium]NIU66325.1 aminotransferase class III-fold pyridoxal phosphate-dependent enzyme [Ac
MVDARRRAQSHLLPNFTRGTAWRDDGLLVIERGNGCYVYDQDGEEYLDGLSGLFCTNLGHGRTDLSAAAGKQMDTLAFYPAWGFANEPAALAASMIAEEAPGDLDMVFFVSSGSEAVESALKLARNYHLGRGDEQRHKVIAREWAYHGTTLGALTVTGIPRFRQPFLPMMWDGVRHVRNTLGDTAEALDSAKAVEEAILAEGPETVSAVFAEPVQNGRGALVPPPGYWQELRRICDTHGVLLVADEVINSFGRLGHFFGSIRYDVVPDIITFAKGVTSAYQPLGGIVVRRPLVEAIWDSPMGSYMHGSTFGGHPVATAVACATIEAMRAEDVPGHVLRHEDRLGDGLREIAGRHDCVREVRGTGFFYAIELMADRDGGVDLSPEDAAALQGGVLNGFLRDARLLVRPDDRGATMLAISPPLVADTGVLDDLLARVDQVLERTNDWLNGAR